VKLKAALNGAHPTRPGGAEHARIQRRSRRSRASKKLASAIKNLGGGMVAARENIMQKPSSGPEKDAARARRLAQWATRPELEAELTKIAEEFEKAFLDDNATSEER
jgi:hypothetical protein